MEDIDAWRSAHHYMKRYGDDAAVRAAKCADELLAMGDTEGSDVWQRIVIAIRELEREKPNDSDGLN